MSRIELGSAEYSLRSLLNNKQAVAIPVFQAPGSNAIEIADQVRTTMEEIKASMPQDVDYEIVYDTTQFVRASIEAVIHTLLEAIALVVIVVIIFLQTWRASIIPLIAVPVSIIGTFAVMQMLGFSINALSLFGLVLAIGIVVDDAIVVVENVERNIEDGLSPREATYKAMTEVSGPIIAIALVLVAVFVPLAFISGLTGQFYKQFALTIAISTVISAFNSLTLSPALAALLLRGHDAPKDRLTRIMDFLFGWFFRGFNAVFSRGSRAYSSGVKGVISRKTLMMGVYLLLVGATVFFFKAVPPGFVPPQDKQYLVGFTQLPDGASLDRTEEVIRRISDISLKVPGVESAIAFPGLSINGFTNSSNAGIVFLSLKPFEERTTPDLSAGAIAGRLNQELGVIKESFSAIFPPPPVQGLGAIGGFKLQLEDKAGLGYEALDAAVKGFMAKAYTTPELVGMFSSYQVNVPQLYADVDRAKARQLNVPLTEIFNTLQIYLGSVYVNDFNKFGRTYSVRVQADANYRAQAEDIGKLEVRSSSGEMIPLSAVLNVTSSAGPERAMRYNGFLAADINGNTAPGYSSGQARAAIERIAAETLPAGVTFEWTELTYQEIIAGNTGILIFPLSILLVFLVLAAQYESLTLPLSIIMIIPMALLAALGGVWLTGGDNNVFTQIGLIVLVGLSAKNAILIVEFARELEFEGATPVRSRHQGKPPAAAPDPDDLDGLHHGCRTAGDLDRRRCGNAPCHGCCGVLRHDRRDAVRPVPHPGLLHTGARHDRKPATEEERTSCRAHRNGLGDAIAQPAASSRARSRRINGSGSRSKQRKNGAATSGAVFISSGTGRLKTLPNYPVLRQRCRKRRGSPVLPSCAPATRPAYDDVPHPPAGLRSPAARRGTGSATGTAPRPRVQDHGWPQWTVPPWLHFAACPDPWH